jgi:hypothetical protein
VSAGRYPDDTFLEELPLTGRLKRLPYTSIRTVGDARRLSDEDFLKMKGYGHLSLMRLRQLIGYPNEVSRHPRFSTSGRVILHHGKPYISIAPLEECTPVEADRLVKKIATYLSEQ